MFSGRHDFRYQGYSHDQNNISVLMPFPWGKLKINKYVCNGRSGGDKIYKDTKQREKQRGMERGTIQKCASAKVT